MMVARRIPGAGIPKPSHLRRFCHVWACPLRLKPDIVAAFPHRSHASFRRRKVFMTRPVEHALDVAVQHEHKKASPPRDTRRKTKLWFVSRRRQR